MPLATRIIPCLDVDAGRVVKGVNFVGIRDAGDPVEVAKRYNEQGADEITFLDITASSDARETIVSVVEQVAEQVFIPLFRLILLQFLIQNLFRKPVNFLAHSALLWQLMPSKQNLKLRAMQMISGKFSRMAVAKKQALMRFSGRKKWMTMALAKSY